MRKLQYPLFRFVATSPESILSSSGGFLSYAYCMALEKSSNVFGKTTIYDSGI